MLCVHVNEKCNNVLLIGVFLKVPGQQWSSMGERGIRSALVHTQYSLVGYSHYWFGSAHEIC